jgi:hypothetical protein
MSITTKPPEEFNAEVDCQTRVFHRKDLVCLVNDLLKYVDDSHSAKIIWHAGGSYNQHQIARAIKNEPAKLFNVDLLNHAPGSLSDGSTMTLNRARAIEKMLRENNFHAAASCVENYINEHYHETFYIELEMPSTTSVRVEIRAHTAEDAIHELVSYGESAAGITNVEENSTCLGWDALAFNHVARALPRFDGQPLTEEQAHSWSSAEDRSRARKDLGCERKGD